MEVAVTGPCVAAAGVLAEGDERADREREGQRAAGDEERFLQAGEGREALPQVERPVREALAAALPRLERVEADLGQLLAPRLLLVHDSMVVSAGGG